MLKHEHAQFRLFVSDIYAKRVLCVAQESCEAAYDSVLDLVDYCHRKLTLLASKATRGDVTTHDQRRETEKAVVSAIEVRKSDIHAAFVGLIVQTSTEESFLPFKSISHLLFFT